MEICLQRNLLGYYSFLESCNLRLFDFGFTLEFIRLHGNQQPKCFYFGIEYKPTDWTCQIGNNCITILFLFKQYICLCRKSCPGWGGAAGVWWWWWWGGGGLRESLPNRTPSRVRTPVSFSRSVSSGSRVFLLSNGVLRS